LLAFVPSPVRRALLLLLLLLPAQPLSSPVRLAWSALRAVLSLKEKKKI
jgi:hypothetical protein